MVTEIAYPVTYACPRCGTSLRAVTDEWRDWLRCPTCGRATRPPLSRRAAPAVEPEVLYIGTFATGPGSDPIVAPAGRSALGLDPARFGRDDGTTRRVILGGGFLISAFLALVSVAQKNPGQAGIFGGVAVILIFLLFRSSARA